MSASGSQRPLYEVLLDHAAATPHAPCVLESNKTHSYADICELAGRTVTALRDNGVRPGDRVALVGSNSAWWVGAYLGIGGAGAAAVPLSGQLPSAEIQRRLAEIEPTAVLSDLAAPEDMSLPWIADSDVRALEPAGSSSAVPKAAPALLVYTSGSEGTPKAACLSELNVLSNTAAIAGYLNLTTADRMCVVLPFTYVYGLSLLHTHIAVGASLVLENRFMFPQVAVDTMKGTACTGFAGVPSTFALLVNRTEIASTELPHLRYVTQAGGAMGPELTKQVVKALPDAALYVMYGATEATARLTYLAPDRLGDKLGSIGRPIDGVTLRIEEGELLAAGPNIMSGYWKDPDATAKVLVERDDVTYYRTGDLAEVDGDGFYTIVGRKRDFIKAGAHRVSAQEVEHAITACPGVMEAAVIGVPDPLRGEAIEAVVVGDVTRQDLSDFLRTRLMAHAIPTSFRFLESLPKNEAGKVLKAVLRGLEKP